MLKLDTTIELDFTRFLRWWGNELSFLIPTSLRRLLGAANDYLLISHKEEGIAIEYLSGEHCHYIGSFTLDKSGYQAQVALFSEKPALSEATVLLRLTDRHSLKKTVKLPIVAEENLLQVIAFEMDRLTPFKSDQVYYSACVTARSPSTRQITVDLIVTPKAKLESILDELAGVGWHPDRVDRVGEKPGVHDMLPAHYRPIKSRLPRIANILFGLCNIILFFTLISMPIVVAHFEAEGLEEQVYKTTKIAKEVESLREEVDALLHQSRFLREKKQTEPILVDVFEELSRVIPDNTWLNGLQYKDRHFVIQGQSPSASKLIEWIEASPYFKNTSFVSPVTKDTSSGLERFQIASDAVNGRFSEDNTVEPDQSKSNDSNQ